MHRAALSVLAGLAITGTAAAGDPCDADLNGDGTVNGLDLAIVLAQWSIPAGSPACGGALPCGPGNEAQVSEMVQPGAPALPPASRPQPN